MSERSPSFGDLMGDITPIKRDKTTAQRPRSVITPGLLQRRSAAQQETALERNGLASEEHIALLKPHDQLSHKRDGVQHGVFKGRNLGGLAPESRVTKVRKFRLAEGQSHWA